MELLATIGMSGGTAATAATVGSATAAGTTSAALLSAPAVSAAGFSATTAAGLSLPSLASGLTLASGALSLFSGGDQADAILDQTRAKTRALELQSNEEKLAAKQEELSAKESGNAVLDNLRRTLGAQQLSFSGNGVDGGSGTVSALAENAVDNAGRELVLTRNDALMRVTARRRRASELLRERGAVQASGSASALDARRSGGLSSVGVISDAIERRVRRG